MIKVIIYWTLIYIVSKIIVDYMYFKYLKSKEVHLMDAINKNINAQCWYEGMSDKIYLRYCGCDHIFNNVEELENFCKLKKLIK